jgi:hypothetical protein
MVLRDLIATKDWTWLCPGFRLVSRDIVRRTERPLRQLRLRNKISAGPACGTTDIQIRDTRSEFLTMFLFCSIYAGRIEAWKWSGHSWGHDEINQLAADSLQEQGKQPNPISGNRGFPPLSPRRRRCPAGLAWLQRLETDTFAAASGSA